MPDFPPFRLDTVNQCLWRHRETAQDERLLFTPKAFAVLRYLVEHAGQLVTQEDLLAAVWPETYIKPEVLKSRIFEIRGVLGDHPKTPRFIETLPGVGTASSPRSTTVRRRRLPSCCPQRPATWWDVRAGWRRCARVCTGPCTVSGSSSWSLENRASGKPPWSTPSSSRLRGTCRGCASRAGSAWRAMAVWKRITRYSRNRGAVPWGWRRCGRRDPGHTRTDLAGAVSRLGDREYRDNLQQELLGTTRERMLREIAAMLKTLTADRPLLLVFEDLQWVDHATVDVLAVLARRRAPVQLLLVATYRPVDLAFWEHPLRALTQELLAHQLCHELVVEPLGEADGRLSRRARRWASPGRPGGAGLPGTRRAIRCSYGQRSTT